MLSKIKKQYQTAVVAFGNSGLPLGKRDDLDDLAIIAHKSKDKSLLKLFEVLPSLEELQVKKTDVKLPELPKREPAHTAVPDPVSDTEQDPESNAKETIGLGGIIIPPAPEKKTRKKE